MSADSHSFASTIRQTFHLAASAGSVTPPITSQSRRQYAVLHQDNSSRRGQNNNSTPVRNLRGTDGKLQEYKDLYEEFAKLKKILDIIRAEYEDSKSFEIFRRYPRLKGMIKRTVMYTKLDILPDVTHALGGTGSLVAMTAPAGIRKPLVTIPQCPKAELSDRIHTLTKRISFVRSQIQQLSESYELSKQYIVFQRYRLMKAMIKGILTNCIDLQYNH